MLLTDAKTRQHFQKIENLYEETFPFEEKKPFDMILKYNGKTFQIIAIEEEEHGEFIGLIILIKYNEFILLDYFAIVKEKRNIGIGTKILKMLVEKYKDKKIILEIESTKEKLENIEDRIRRKSFYLKNNFKLLPFNVDLFGIEMEILSNSENVKFDEYFELCLNQFNGEMKEKIRNNIKLIKL